MKVLLVGEGKHELSGALEKLAQRLCPTKISCVSERVSRSDIHAFHGKGPGYFKRALRWVIHAEKQGYDAIILVIDEDGKPERIAELLQAQNHVFRFPRALGVAVKTFDAWMLADEAAIGKALACTISAPKSPERNRDPKKACKALLASSATGLTQSEFYRQIAEYLDIEVVRKRCKKGFKPFAERVRKLPHQ